MLKFLFRLKDFQTLLFIFSIVCLLFCTILSESRKDNELPKFYFTSKIQKCPIDSPELYYEEVAFTSLSTVVQEGRIFFGVLMDNLESALVDDSEEYEKLQEIWEDFTKSMSENFDLKSRRIDAMWDKVIVTYETIPLPWEIKLQKAVIFEIFCGLHYEYLILEALIKTGTKEVIGSLQGPFGNVVRKLGEKLPHQGEGDTSEMMKRAEEMLLEVEPTFVGRLLARMLKNGRKIKQNIENGIKIQNTNTFLTEPIEQIGIMVEAYKDKSQDYPNNFWKQMTTIMKNDTNTLTGDQIYMLYSKNEERLIVNILNCLATGKQKE